MHEGSDVLRWPWVHSNGDTLLLGLGTLIALLGAITLAWWVGRRDSR